mmetsp:Transcript_18189/g.25880  ORF Transcript_18189/g.25880 Transcript_18189/m.25880 type:complete len:131 (+) Transcript_18189:26-418(+)
MRLVFPCTGNTLNTSSWRRSISKSTTRWLKPSNRWSTFTFEAAARHGNLSYMKWLHAKGCPWDEQTFWAAATKGDLENMKWLKANGCPWDSQTLLAAVEHGSFDNVRWLIENGCPFDFWVYESYFLGVNR